MPAYRADLMDIEFNLFELLKVNEHTGYGLDLSSMREILSEYEKFVRQEIFPTRQTSDHEGVKFEGGKVYAPQCLHAVHKGFYKNGWFALGLPEDIGGTPVPEALSLACISLANGANTAYMMYPGLTKAAMNVIRLKGDEQMKKNYLPPIMEGRWGGTMCLTEAGAGSDVGALRSTATPLSDGTWSIKGTKIFISSGEVDLYENTIHLVLARTPKGGPGSKGISLFIVPRIWVNEKAELEKFNNVQCTKVEEKMGIHASATCEMQFGNSGESRGYLIGDECDGMATMFIMMNEARLICSLQGESQANLAYEMSRIYASERSQFNQEIIQHPDVRRMLLKMRAVSRAMRQLMLYTGNLFDLEKQDPRYAEIIGLLTPICKAHFTDQALEVSAEAVQIHGGYGFCKEYGVEQFVRDTIIGKIYEGTNGIQAIDFVMRKIMKDQAKAFTWLGEMMLKDIMDLKKIFPSDVALWESTLNSVSELTKVFIKAMSEKKQNYVLTHASDYLKACSYIIMTWQLGKAASKANFNLQSGKGTSVEKEYWETRLVDFQIYCSHYLVHAQALTHGMTMGKLELSNCKI